MAPLLFPLGVAGLAVSRPLRVPAAAVALFVAVLSAVGHKEHRFLQPVVPWLCLGAGALMTSHPCGLAFQ